MSSERALELRVDLPGGGAEVNLGQPYLNIVKQQLSQTPNQSALVCRESPEY
ncbi:hypothetical protein PAXRUDRAFT_20190 [Paxillus rubicundulus Ve08.2h10]|uniref:Uncharacterized protein n=1 Tax=Paxillus rubicundulus Ve08.2h10 TaxID=930991 RepID=A0A0D0CT00_9AGAM|nr:hypothetical protein PAXRUDRAFT_20190 [Paxillus rubicundulus Ve08.2h10]